MSMIGKPFKRYDSNSNDGLGWLGWFCTISLALVCGFMVYLCWFEQSVTYQPKASPAYTLEGMKAIHAGYFWSAMFMASFYFVLIHRPYRRLIYLILFLIWLSVVIWVHFNLSVSMV